MLLNRRKFVPGSVAISGLTVLVEGLEDIIINALAPLKLVGISLPLWLPAQLNNEAIDEGYIKREGPS